MFEIYFFIAGVICFNIFTHYTIYKDDVYMLDEEKPKYKMMVWLLPVLGGLIAFQRLHADKNFYMGVMIAYFVLKFGLYYLMFGIL